jgi:uroporphyrinogen decarboxylase
MQAKQCTIDALELRQPESVPHFELEMQLCPEFFGEDFATAEEWNAPGADRRALLRRDAKLFRAVADRFDYGIVLYSRVHRPTEEHYREGLRMLCEEVGERSLVMCHGDPTPSIPDGSDMDRVIVDMMVNPEQVKERLERAVDDHLERARELKSIGIDGVIMCADYCFNSGPYLSPVMFSDIITPRLARLIQGYRELGLYAIKHTDGNIMPILGDLLETAPHALHSLDPMAGVDMEQVKQRTAGRLCLIGNVNCALMQTGTDEEVLESCRYALEHGRPGGGYIFSTSNVIFRGMEPRRYELMWNWWREHAAYARS